MSYKSHIENMQKAGISGRSQSFVNVYTKLMDFDRKLQELPEDRQLMSFSSDEMSDLIKDCDKYIKSHHPFSSEGRKRLKEMKELRDSLQSLRVAGNSIKEYDQYVTDNITSPMLNAEDALDSGNISAGRSEYSRIRDMANDDLASKVRMMTLTVSNAMPEWGGVDIFTNALETRAKTQLDLAAQTAERMNTIDAAIQKDGSSKTQSRVKVSFADLNPSAASASSRQRTAAASKNMTKSAPGRKM